MITEVGRKIATELSGHADKSPIKVVTEEMVELVHGLIETRLNSITQEVKLKIEEHLLKRINTELKKQFIY